MGYDMTLCDGEECPLKNKCYRHLIKPVGRQDFFNYSPYDTISNTCGYFMKVPMLEDDYIKTVAYYMWQNRGRPLNNDEKIWFEARNELIKYLKNIVREEYKDLF